MKQQGVIKSARDGIRVKNARADESFINYMNTISLISKFNIFIFYDSHHTSFELIKRVWLARMGVKRADSGRASVL